jgi:O-acetyl-ADP-ribose deacetylase
MAEIVAVRGDITKQSVDAIVTAANSSLMGGGGVDWAVHRAAGRRLAEAGRALGPCPPGEAVATPGFDLDPPVRYVIHAVGPVWRGGEHDEAGLLASCYRRSLVVADELGVASIAFPAISTGAFGFPPERAAPIAVHTLHQTPTRVRLITLVAFDGYTHRLLARSLAAETGRH